MPWAPGSDLTIDAAGSRDALTCEVPCTTMRVRPKPPGGGIDWYASNVASGGNRVRKFAGEYHDFPAPHGLWHANDIVGYAEMDSGTETFTREYFT